MSTLAQTHANAISCTIYTFIFFLCIITDNDEGTPARFGLGDGFFSFYGRCGEKFTIPCINRFLTFHVFKFVLARPSYTLPVCRCWPPIHFWIIVVE